MSETAQINVGDVNALTPMIRQYLSIKEQYKDCILFFRLGDFYEMFFDDAVTASRLLQITLTARSKGENAVPMCGVPFHAATNYIAKLTRAGKKVAICEQLSDPNLPGIVRRDVVQIITPGTTMDDNVLEQKTNNFVLGLLINDSEFDVAYADISTGEFFKFSSRSIMELRAEIERIRPAEIIIPSNLFENSSVKQLISSFQNTYFFGFDSTGINAEEYLMNYFSNIQKSSVPHLAVAKHYEISDFMPLDEATLRNLELLTNLRENKKEGSLLWVLDQTLTAMGGRLLRNFVTHPLVDKKEIELRLDAVWEMKNNHQAFYELDDLLKSILDMERLLSKLSLGKGNPRDLIALKNSLLQIPKIKNCIGSFVGELMLSLNSSLIVLDELVALIEKAIVPEPPIALGDGGYIADGFNKELDELKSITKEGKQFIHNLQQREIERTGINNLKVRFNKVFGYYLEVSKSHIGRVPADFIRKQTLVNAERFITPELKEYEEKILGAEEKIFALEQKIFTEVRQQVVLKISEIQQNARNIALIDVIRSFAKVAMDNNYCKPEINDSEDILIKNGRHPVVEKMSFSMQFVPNDTRLEQNGERFLLITGPNMGGKSTYLRQVALISLMAQMGCFVPAEKAELAILDRIFTRVGASDNLVRGQSTFMVEMQETAHILKNATNRSLIILDEIGRGTSTYDGMSIAWSIMEYIHDKIGAKTLFATHYHELIPLADNLPRAANYAVMVRENAEEGVVFLFKIAPGGIDRSYGIEVAKLAGLPVETIDRARHILSDLDERHRVSNASNADELSLALDEQQILSPLVYPALERHHGHPLSANETALRDELDKIDTNNITPLEALKRLAELKKLN
jgi:DNA mismatch repair protein MutS